MGVLVEFNNILALRSLPDSIESMAGFTEIDFGRFIPAELIEGGVYHFHKEGYRVYPLNQNIPLVVTQGNCNITEVLAIVKIANVCVTYDIDGTKLWTTGKYVCLKKFEEPEKSAWLMFVKERSVPNLGISTASVSFGV